MRVGRREIVEQVLLSGAKNDLVTHISDLLGLRRVVRESTNLIIDIRDVHNKLDVELEVVAHDAANDIRANIVASVSQMRIVILSHNTVSTDQAGQYAAAPTTVGPQAYQETCLASGSRGMKGFFDLVNVL